MINNPKRVFFIFSLALLIAMSLVNIFAIGSFYEKIFLYINITIFEPLLMWSTSLLISAFILLFFNQKIFSTLFKKVYTWYIPLGLLLTFLSDPYASYTFPDRVWFATFFGTILVVTTLIFALVQKFLYKK